MFKEKLAKMANEKREQIKNLNAAMINSDSKEERMALGKTLDSVKNELEELERLLADIDKPADDKKPADGKKPDMVVVDDDVLVDDQRGFNVAATMEMRNGKTAADAAEKRAKAFVETSHLSVGADEARSVLLASGGIAKPETVSGINNPFNVISTVVDLVQVEDMTGMGGHKEVYVQSWQEADAGTDGVAPTPNDPTFKTVMINPFLLNVMTYVSKELKKQTPLQYEAKVREGALIALKKKLNSWIVGGNGSTQIYGIVNAVNTDSESMTQALEIAAIDEKTLRNIVFNYGGDENVGGGATLILNKNDLIAFGDVRGSDKKPVYEITPDGSNPNRGTIRDGGLTVPYVICSAVPALTGAAAETKTMLYGEIKGYKLGLFGNYEVNVSEDYKFGEGLLTVRGEVMVGGNVVVDKGFVVVTAPESNG